VQGSQGTIGTQGLGGTQGTTGSQGIQGVQGATATQGLQGLGGTQGTSGAQGAQGGQGVQGTIGAQGLSGIDGAQGAQSTQGLQGPQGIQGKTGSQGIQGSAIQGTQGIQGLQGIQGIQGFTGTQGAQGLQGIVGIPAVYSDATPQNLGSASPGTASSAARGDHVHNLPTLSVLGLGTSNTPQFAGLGLGIAAASGWELTANGGVVQNRSTVSVSGSTYTMDVQAANEFVTPTISTAVTINLTNLENIPTGYVWRGVLTLSYTGGTISWFSGNSTYFVRWDGGSAIVPTVPVAGGTEVEKVVIEVVGGRTIIDVAALSGRAD